MIIQKSTSIKDYLVRSPLANHFSQSLSDCCRQKVVLFFEDLSCAAQNLNNVGIEVLLLDIVPKEFENSDSISKRNTIVNI